MRDIDIVKEHPVAKDVLNGIARRNDLSTLEKRVAALTYLINPEGDPHCPPYNLDDADTFDIAWGLYCEVADTLVGLGLAKRYNFSPEPVGFATYVWVGGPERPSISRKRGKERMAEYYGRSY